MMLTSFKFSLICARGGSTLTPCLSNHVGTDPRDSASAEALAAEGTWRAEIFILYLYFILSMTVISVHTYGFCGRRSVS